MACQIKADKGLGEGKGEEQAAKKQVVLDGAGREVPTLAEVRASIPKHCFKHSVVTALGHVVRDACVIGAFGAAAWIFLPGENLTWFHWALWMVYGFWQGAAITGWWVLAHECGHGGFSQYTWLNDCVGWVLHSLLLVPYYSWQFSHGKHHANTNSIMDGESHVPNSKAEIPQYEWLFEKMGEEAFAGWQVIAHLLLGWPTYLIFNFTGAKRLHNKSPIDGAVLDHFRPWSKLFPPGWETRVFVSTLGCLLTLAGLAVAGAYLGHLKVALMYWPAYLWCNAWLVLYTWLQHTKEDIPQYGESDWTWMKGALSTIDRPYSECFYFFDWMHHHIGSTHVCHHIFSRMPCYHAVEATRHLKEFLEPRGLYNYDARPILVATWQTAKNCHYLDDLTGTQYYKSFAQKDAKKSD